MARKFRHTRKPTSTKTKDAEDIEVVGEAKNGREAVELTRNLHPAVVLMDIAMPLLNGLEATRRILSALPSTKVIILSAHNDDAYVQHATQAGAVGYLLKQAPLDVLAQAIREVQEGHLYFFRSIAKCLRDRKSTRTQKKRQANRFFPGAGRASPGDPLTHQHQHRTLLL
jgi:DNA-binding NarL/FixJ family response regulator